MKKILFSVALLLGGMAVVSAQNLTITPVDETSYWVYFIPKMFTSANQSTAYIYPDNEAGYGSAEIQSANYPFTIFDKDFNVAHEFTYSPEILKSYTLVETRIPGSEEWEQEQQSVWYVPSKELLLLNYINGDSDSPTEEYYIGLTQTLFNDDDKYEFLVAKHEIIETQGSNNDSIRKETRYSVETTAIEIVSEDGKVLSSIPLSTYGDGCVYTYNGKNYIQFESPDKYILYRIDKESSSLQEIAMPTGMKMFPTLARPSDEITIEFEPSADNTVRTLSVSDASGRTVEQCTVAPDASRITVSARRFHAGTYIFTLTENGKQVDNGKIIVK